MKKLKLVMSIATMCLAIAVLCFGVLAATSVTYTIEGTISYDVEDVYVDVNTTVYKSAKYLSATEQSRLTETLGDPANLSSAKTTYALTETGDSNSFSTLNTENPTALSDLALTFNKDVKTYAIVVNVKNLTDKNAWAVVDSRTSTSTNVQIADNYQLNIAKDGTGKNVVIIVTPKDVTQPIADTTTFTFNLVFGSDEYVNSATNMSKMTISGNSVTKKDSNISGVLVIPSSVTSIGSNAFDWCEKLTSITIPNSVTSIEYNAFYWCAGLTSVIFEEESKLNTISYEAFYNCSSLTSITIPSSVTSIGFDTFSYCFKLHSVIFEEGSRLTSISSSLFANCPNLTYIEIPSSVTSIGMYAFEDCKSLTNIEIPSSVTSIREGAFCHTPWLEGLSADSNGLQIVTSRDNANVKFLFGYTGSLTTITAEMLSDVQVICAEAFDSNKTLQSITIPSGVTSIGDRAFCECSSLTSITIPSSVTSIGNSAFSGCSNLTSATFEDPNGWKAGSTEVTLTDQAQNATYLTSTYRFDTWTKTV